MTKPKTIQPISEIDLNQVRSSRYDDNVERLGDHPETCFLCGKKTSKELYVHYTTTGMLTNKLNHSESQGYFPIGPECAKKLPINFIHFKFRKINPNKTI